MDYSVVLLWCLNTARVAFIAHFGYWDFITNFGDVIALLELPWSVAVGFSSETRCSELSPSTSNFTGSMFPNIPIKLSHSKLLLLPCLDTE
ncbi:hypothetical protein PHLGIDRAFT_327478 [Phlebiopsis gigantea 11061_1 CR5-6]|uniref:Uncharacterized protein n=1 Tax=Phlebiopsis gigantea (strain 11061_1 CR5-6) TaxID=745531 RepID=A0A0C3PW87_PHLG1|nr:hypothetical protein PHLGIDRAFT_327478 [Phlebiopsis gigantea 11061_1 CR5-6]